MNSPIWIYCIGLLAQIFFTARVLVQWYLAEKWHRNESPSLFWILSLAGSITLFVYGWLRNDITIIAGETMAYYIYLWNISNKGLFNSIPRVFLIIFALLPPLTFIFFANGISEYSIGSLISDSTMPLWLMFLGFSGQFIFKMRFVYQFIYSYRRGNSLMPLNFWIIAVVGSTIIIVYSLIRHDWVLLLGQFSIIPSIRNILIACQNNNEKNTI